MQPPVVIGWSHLPLAVRIGTALFPQDASAPEALLELAASPADPLGPDPRSA